MYRISVSIGIGEPDRRKKVKKSVHLQLPRDKRGTPFAFFEGSQGMYSKVSGSSVPESNQPFSCPFIDGVCDTYYSSAFPVRYLDESRDLNDGVHFRIQLNPFTDRSSPLTLVVVLEHTEFKNPNKFTTLISKHVRVNFAMEGIHEYFPVIFNESSAGFAVVEASIHTCLVNTRYEPSFAVPDLSSFLIRLHGNSCYRPHSKLGQEVKLMEFLQTVRNVCLSPLQTSNNRLVECFEMEKRCSSIQTEFLSLSRFQIENDVVEENQTIEEFAEILQNELEFNFSKLIQNWHLFLNHLHHNKSSMASMGALKQEWLKRAKERAGEAVLRNSLSPDDMILSTTFETKQERDFIAGRIRESNHQIRQLQKDFIEDDLLFQDESASPVFFEENYSTNNVNHEEETGLHVVVLMHGFMGSSWDVRPLRNFLAILEPNARTFLSTSNEDDTDSSIRVLGFRFAHELSDFLNGVEASGNGKISRISVISHSIGSIILRCALTHKKLSRFIPKLHTLMSLSSPHLGSCSIASSLVKIGMMAMQFFRKADALLELAMNDSPDKRQSFMYKLSTSLIGVHCFKHVLLVSGHQDLYVPYHSARIQPPSQTELLESSEIESEMANNILRRMKPEQLIRVDLSFQFGGKTKKMDQFIGRAAHIKVLDSQALALSLLLNYQHLFS